MGAPSTERGTTLISLGSNTLLSSPEEVLLGECRYVCIHVDYMETVVGFGDSMILKV